MGHFATWSQGKLTNPKRAEKSAAEALTEIRLEGFIRTAESQLRCSAPRGWRVSAADLPANSWAELKDGPSGADQLPIRRVVLCLGRGGLDVEHGAVGKPATQLAGLLVDVSVIDRAAD
jgi:hypothetical protein